MARKDDPIKLVHCCTWDVGMGGGVARMDSYFYNFLNRDLFDPVFLVPDEPNPGNIPYHLSIPYIFTGRDNRFDVLMEQFSGADAVMYSSRYHALICETARLARVPALVEVAHNIESGQIYPSVDITVCVSKTVRRYQPLRRKTAVIYNGIDLQEFSFRKETLKDDKIILLQVSNRKKPYFNLDELAEEILPLDPRIEIRLAGSGQDRAST